MLKLWLFDMKEMRPADVSSSSASLIAQFHVFKGKKDKFIRIIRKVERNYHPVEPAIFTAFFHDLGQCEDRSTYYREHLPKHAKPITEAI